MKILSTAILLIFLSSCLTHEEITPAFQVERIDDQVSDVQFSFSTESQDYSNELDEIGDIDNIGPSLRDFFTRWINNDFENGELDEVMHLDPIEYSLDEISDVDFDYIEKIKLESVRLIMQDYVEETGSSVDFSFIKNFRIYIKYKELFKEGEDVSIRYNDALLVLSYDKETEKLSCDGKCLDLKIEKSSWRDILENNHSFVVLVRVELENIPTAKFSYEGQIDVSVGVRIGL